MILFGLFLNNEIRTGGHVRYLELMEALAERGHTVFVLLNERLDYSPRFFNALLVRAVYRRKSFPPASIIFERAARSAIRKALLTVEGKVDAVLIFGETHLAAGTTFSRGTHAPLIYGHRSNSVGEARAYRAEALGGFDLLRSGALEIKAKIDEARITRHADLIVFQTPFDESDFLSRNQNAVGRTAIIRGNIGEPRFSSATRDTNTSVNLSRIVFIGTLGRRKGVRYLIRALSSLREKEFVLPKLDVYGAGDAKPFLSEISALGLSQLVQYHGKTTDPIRTIAMADLVVVPSLYDSYPNVVLEALHAGTPVIGSNVGGIPDILDDPELLFPPADAEGLAILLSRLITDHAFYANVKKKCRARAEYFHFDWAAAWEKRINLLCDHLH